MEKVVIHSGDEHRPIGATELVDVANLPVSADAGNALSKKADGLFAPEPAEPSKVGCPTERVSKTAILGSGARETQLDMEEVPASKIEVAPGNGEVFAAIGVLYEEDGDEEQVVVAFAPFQNSVGVFGVWYGWSDTADITERARVHSAAVTITRLSTGEQVTIDWTDGILKPLIFSTPSGFWEDAITSDNYAVCFAFYIPYNS